MQTGSCSCCQWCFNKVLNKGVVEAEEGRIFGEKLINVNSTFFKLDDGVKDAVQPAADVLQL